MKQYCYIAIAVLALGVVSGCQQIVDADGRNPTVDFSRYRPQVTTGSDGRPLAYIPTEDVTDDAANWYANLASSTQNGYSVNHNLAAQIAEPCDLVSPKRLGAPNPMAATGAVESYQKGEVTALTDQKVSVGRD